MSEPEGQAAQQRDLGDRAGENVVGRKKKKKKDFRGFHSHEVLSLWNEYIAAHLSPFSFVKLLEVN